MKKKIITISRQYGSGGRYIAQLLAERLGIAFYDKELIAMAAKESGIDQEFFADNEEIIGSDDRYLSTLSKLLGHDTGGTFNLSLRDRMYITQCNLIEQLATQESAVFVGRCANMVLKDMPECINVFIQADVESRKERAITQYSVDVDQADEVIRKIDRKRKNYYEYYTGGRWGDASHFHIVIDSGKFSAEEIVDMLAMLMEK